MRDSARWMAAYLQPARNGTLSRTDEMHVGRAMQEGAADAHAPAHMPQDVEAVAHHAVSRGEPGRAARMGVRDLDEGWLPERSRIACGRFQGSALTTRMIESKVARSC